MDNKQLGLFVGKIRTEKNISMEALCEGVCTQSFLSSIESGEKNTSKFMLDLLLQRLGVSEDGYKCYLSQSEYKSLRGRYHILNFIENDEIDKTKKELELYIKNFGLKNKFHLQFILHIESRLLILEENNYKLAYEKIRQAMLLTMPRIEKTKLSNLILGFKELFLATEYVRLKSEAFHDTSTNKRYEEIISYIENNECEDLIKAKLYPKVICLACKYWFLDNEHEKILSYCNKAIDYLQSSGKLYFMPNILENKRLALESINNKNKFCVAEKSYKFREYENEYIMTIEWENMIKDLFLEYDVVNEPYDWYPYYCMKETYSIGDVIKKGELC